jgi:hypothetical protein
MARSEKIYGKILKGLGVLGMSLQAAMVRAINSKMRLWRRDIKIQSVQRSLTLPSTPSAGTGEEA